MITRTLVWALGTSQLLLWGTTYYLIAVFGEPIVRDTGWPRTAVYGGFSVALVVMALTSGVVGRLIDRRGGRVVMGAGSVVAALGCVGLAVSRDLPAFYAAWALLGVAMRMALYDAAFASLVRIGGPEARRPISQITLLGGLASTILWPVGQALVERVGWRMGLVAYAAIALATLPLHLAIPAGRYGSGQAGPAPAAAPRADTPRLRVQAGILFATVATLASLLNAVMSAHMIAMLGGLGMAAGIAVWTATLRGIGQSAARLAEVLFGRRFDPFLLGLLASSLLPAGLAVGLWSGASEGAGMVFALAYGAGNGILTIVRGTQPLLLFDSRTYGQVVGRLLGPSFLVSALAPAAVALVIERHGVAAALDLCIAAGILLWAASASLWWLVRRR